MQFFSLNFLFIFIISELLNLLFFTSSSFFGNVLNSEGIIDIIEIYYLNFFNNIEKIFLF